MPQRKKISIALIAGNESMATTIRDTLAHAYPGITLTIHPADNSLAMMEEDIAVVDTLKLGPAKLDHVLNCLPDIPVLIVVDGMNDIRGLSHLMQGRRELITLKGIEGLTLIQAVHHLLDRQRLHTQLTKTAQHLKELSIRDDMTRLYNHRHFNEILIQEVKKSNRYKRPLGLVMIALKNFTAINETYGHHEGDRLLARAAGIINATVRDVDITARYGDNEFAVILPETDEEASLKAGGRIFDALSQLTVNDGDTDNPISISVGVSALNAYVRTKEELLKAALRALIEAKRSNKKAPIRCASEVVAVRRQVHEDRHLIDQLSERVKSIVRRAEQTCFQEVLKSIAEIPAYRKTGVAHAERVAFYAERLATKIGLGEEEVRHIRRASLLHDIGKLAIDVDIVNKPATLTVEETTLVRQHPQFGVQIIGKSKLMQAEPDIILHHHERYDGSGYPEGLMGETISVGARIVAITEAWDTMITPQPYRREPVSLDKALAELRAGSGTQFDPELVDLFIGLITG